MTWLLRLRSVIAAAVTSLFVAREALNFGFIQILVTMVLTIGIAATAVGWHARRQI